MTPSGLVFLASIAATGWFLWRHVRVSLSLASTLLGLMLLLHGPAYWYYTRQWGPGRGSLFQSYNELWPQSQTLHDRILSALPDVDVVSVMDLALALTFLALCAGIWLMDRFHRLGAAENLESLQRWSTNSEARRVTPQSRRRLIVLALAGLVIMGAFLIRDSQLVKIHMYFTSVAGEFEKIAMRRQYGGSSSYLYNVLLGTALPFVAFCLWAGWRNGAQPLMGWLAGAFILLVVVAKLATLSKAPAAIFILQLLVLEIARRSLLITARQALLAGSMGLLLFVAMTFVANSDLANARQSLLFLFYRVFMIPNESLLEYFAAFPHQLAHTLGHDIRWLARAMGVEPLQASFWRVAELHQGTSGSTTTAMFMADAWAAFSWVGVVGVSMAFGMLIRWLDINLIVKRGPDCATLGGLGLGHYGVFIGLSTAFQTALITGGLALVLPLVFLVGGRPRCATH